MRDEEISIGDTLRIKKWDDIVAEFGVDKNGNVMIDEWCVFAKDAMHLCGEFFTIKERRDRFGQITYQSVEEIERIDESSWWCVYPEVLEDPHLQQIITEDEFLSLFKGGDLI